MPFLPSIKRRRYPALSALLKKSALSGDFGGLKKRMVFGLFGLHKKGASNISDKTDTLKKRSVNDDRQRHDTGGGA